MFGRDRDRDGPDEMALHGDTAAWGLCDGCAGDPDGGSGWRGALQAAADASGQDQGVLQVTDEIYAFAHLMTSTGAIRAYAEAAHAVSGSASARRFLEGMLHHLDQRP